MNLAVIGTGYVGLVAGACFANAGHCVICVDNNIEKLKKLKNGTIPIYEPKLEEIVSLNIKEDRLTFTADLSDAVKKSDVCFIAVSTPSDKDGSADLSYVSEVARQIAYAMNGYKLIVNKSTVPVGTAKKITKIIKENTIYPFDIVSNPEFLRQGSAIDDFLYPDRIIIGSDSVKATEIMREIYFPLLKKNDKIILMDIESAEMTKYAANSFLATKISFMNELAKLCEHVGANIDMVRTGISTDSRIGDKFLSSGIGFGGSCFPKDVKALIKTGCDNNCEMSIVKATDKANSNQREYFIQKIISKFNTDLKSYTFAIWGLAFKPNTDDMREAPSITIINKLLDKGAKIKAYDPKAISTAKKIFENRIEYAVSPYEALKDSDALLLLTEWKEFCHPDFEKMKILLKNPIIFDGRNQYDCDKIKEMGFEYYCIGKKND